MQIKHAALITAIAGLSIAGSTDAAPIDITSQVDNPSFELGTLGGASIPTDWSRNGTGSGLRTNVAGITPTDGSRQVWVNNGTTLYQETGETIVDGTEYTFSIEFNPDQINFSNQETVFVRLYGSTSGYTVAFAEVSELGPSGAPVDNGAQWATASVTWTATGAEDGQKLGVAFGVTSGTQSEWDKVQLTANPVPEPGSLALLGLGGLLIARRRRG